MSTECLTNEQLMKLTETELSQEEAKKVLNHLFNCNECKTTIAEIFGAMKVLFGEIIEKETPECPNESSISMLAMRDTPTPRPEDVEALNHIKNCPMCAEKHSRWKFQATYSSVFEEIYSQ